VIQPYEEGKVEIVLDTRLFRGPKRRTLYLKMDNGKTMEARFTVTADSQEGPQP
jgi:hypothetical protein